jgi:tRNA dimethylallyltransferase
MIKRLMSKKIKNMNNKFVILISGPTATGKSDLAIKLGINLPIEIVNADIGSFYTNLTIGAAKPDWKSSTIPHHFFDVIDDASNWTAPQFREKLEILLGQIWVRGNIPVVVGGSAFYIQAFFYKNHTLELPQENLIESLEEQSAADLWEQLNSIDPERAAKIDSNDQYRLVRALAIWKTQGQKPSEFQPIFNPIAPFYFISLTRDRDQLYEIINSRVGIMMENGWLDEVRSLIDDDQWVQFMLKKKMIGYDLLAQYLLGYQADQSLDEIIDLIAQRTRNYAKRQITFLKKLTANIEKDKAQHKNDQIRSSVVEECNLTLCDLSLYIKQLSERISQF